MNHHGFGHMAITGLILKKFKALHPDAVLALQCRHDPKRFPKLFDDPVWHEPASDDFGLVMHSATAVDLEASRQAYRALHGTAWSKTVERQKRRLDRFEPDLVLSNISYIALAAATELGVPAIGISALNWLELHSLLLGSDPQEEQVRAEMSQAYVSAKAVFATEPAMPFAGLSNVIRLDPIVPAQSPQRARLTQAIARSGAGPLQPEERLVVLSFGGVQSGLDLSRWPKQFRGWRLMVWDAVEAAGNPAILSLEALDLAADGQGPMGFPDLAASVDTIIAKPGYGIITEATAAGTPLLIRDRKDWPESPYLLDWLSKHGRWAEISPEELARGEIVSHLDALITGPPIPPLKTGGEQAVVTLMDQLVTGKEPNAHLL